MKLLAIADGTLARLEEREGQFEATRVLTDRDVQCVARDPGDAATIYAGTRGEGALKSTDSGRMWTDHRPGVLTPGETPTRAYTADAATGIT